MTRRSQPRRRLRAAVCVVVLGIAASACTSSSATTATPPSTTTTGAIDDDAGLLAELVINDRPHTANDYHREDWPTWEDTDGDGCDARQQALRAASTTPAQVADRCTVIAGQWTSAYDGTTTGDPSTIDIDHVVPLDNAHISGGWAWTPERRVAYANDQADLWAVSAKSNRAKGAGSPDQWRPPDEGVWCLYARRWLAIKIRWQLTATTRERDALGQMLETCPH